MERSLVKITNNTVSIQYHSLKIIQTVLLLMLYKIKLTIIQPRLYREQCACLLMLIVRIHNTRIPHLVMGKSRYLKDVTKTTLKYKVPAIIVAISMIETSLLNLGHLAFKGSISLIRMLKISSLYRNLRLFAIKY